MKINSYKNVTGIREEMNFIGKLKNDLNRNKILYLMVFPVVLFYLIFSYVPMYGAIIAFKNFVPAKGIFGSDWVGFAHFRDFFQSYNFSRVMRNTVMLSVYNLLFGFPAPIILALLLNEVKNRAFKKVVQTISYVPHFVSLVVVCGIIRDFVLSDGIINDIIAFFGGERIAFLQHSRYYRTIYIASGIWQHTGWGSIIYMAALSGIDIQLYEAAIMDGAGKLRQTWHITLPGLKPTIIILFILNVGKIFTIGSQKTILLYNPAIYETADIISSYVYRVGLQQFNMSFSTAVGLFDSVLNFTLLIITNKISRRISEISLW